MFLPVGFKKEYTSPYCSAHMMFYVQCSFFLFSSLRIEKFISITKKVMIIQMYSCRFQELYFCFVYVQCSFNNNEKYTKEGHDNSNVFLQVSKEFYFCFICVQCSFNNNKKQTKEGHNTPNVLLHVSKEFYFCFIYVKWSLDNNKKHTKEGHNNPEVFLQVSKEQNAW